MYDEDALTMLGKKLGKLVQGGGVIELVGDVGAGKTTLTKAIASGIGIVATIQSPTFTISNRYDAPGGTVLVHYDFYRLHDAGIMSDELDDTINQPGAVVVIEWSDIVRGILPEDHLRITLQATGETTRDVIIEGLGKHSQALARSVAE